MAQKYLQPEKRGIRICEGNSSADTNGSGEGRGGGVQDTGAEIPL